MINTILNAYEEIERQRSDSFLGTIKRISLEDRIFFATECIIFVSMMIALLTHHDMVSIWLTSGFVLISFVWTLMAQRNYKKDWCNNLIKYNEKLDRIKEILLRPENNLYEKNKLKQLIRKYNSSIEELELKNTKAKEQFTNFFRFNIIPILAFVAGKLCEELNGFETIELALLGIFLLFAIKLLGNMIGTMQTQFIEDNELERKRYFVHRLQDLLDRDFEIEENDLL